VFCGVRPISSEMGPFVLHSSEILVQTFQKSKQRTGTCQGPLAMAGGKVTVCLAK